VAGLIYGSFSYTADARSETRIKQQALLLATNRKR
jgi:hypothetical protein